MYQKLETQNVDPQVGTSTCEERQGEGRGTSPREELQNGERRGSLPQQIDTPSPTNIRDDWETTEPVIIPVTELLLNGGPPTQRITFTPTTNEAPGGVREEEIPSHKGEKDIHPQKIREQK